MAYLKGDDDRGQLLLVTVLILAAAFIALALVVNSAIFTENLATRDDTAGAEEALEYRAEVVGNVEALIEEANADSSLTSESDLGNHVREGTAGFVEAERSRQALAGQSIEVETEDIRFGTRIAQENADRNLTNLNNDADWTVASNVDATRNVTFTFTEIDTFEPDGLFGGEDDPFLMELDGPDGTWTFQASSEGAALFGVDLEDEVAFSIQRDGTGFDEACVRDDDELADGIVVDLTAGTINGEPCEGLSRIQTDGTALSFGVGVGSPYSIDFVNADNVEGTYSMITTGAQSIGSVGNNQNDDVPYAVNAIYDVSLSYLYQTHDVVYETDIRAAPEEVRHD